jgi:hypothetical protein
MPIDITTIKDFPTQYINAFNAATNHEPIFLFYRNIHHPTEYIFSLEHLSDKIILSPATATRYDDVVFDDLHTSHWWSQMQSKVGNEKVIIPLMLSSDATIVSGNCKTKAWPMYMTIGNVPKDLRYVKGYGASRVLAYLPVITTLSNTTQNKWLSLCKTAIFQHCMRIILEPFSHTEQQQNGIPMTGPNGKVYSCVTMLATYSADYPEQCLLTATRTWRNGYGCPRCLIKAKDYKKGLDMTSVIRRNNDNMKIYSRSDQFGCFPVDNAFWDADYDVYSAMITDDLHQLGGIYRHLIQYVERIVKKTKGNAAEVERRCQELPVYTGLKRFRKGFLYSNLTNPTFDEFRKHMQLILCLVHDMIPVQCVLCIRAFIDFFIQICSKEHTSSTLKSADEYLALFFHYLPAFQDYSKMLMPKLHMMTKYTSDIKMKGPLDGYTTMHSERLHKKNAKQPSKRTNFRDAVSFTKQLTQFIEDRDVLFDLYGSSSPNSVPVSQNSPSSQQQLFDLRSPHKETIYHNIDSLEQHQQNLHGLHRHVRLYLHYLNKKSTKISLAHCAPLTTPSIMTYGQLQMIETNDDMSTCKTWIRAGVFYNNTYNDFVRCVDVTKQKVSNRYREFFGKVMTFIEVVYDGKKYRLCVGHLFKETNVAHKTGYKTLFLNSSPRPEMFVCCVEHILEKVYIVPGFGDANDDGDPDSDVDNSSDGSVDDNNDVESDDDDLVEFSQY